MSQLVKYMNAFSEASVVFVASVVISEGKKMLCQRELPAFQVEL